ncbi:hypothetical protein [Chitinophaga sp. Ak27]|uniref:hypothetical protein n=1 Tax=Chitinophaga sp. Ak27 TaxID=2726116 RepID=UPI00145D1937|nr:hypothetical protein [Chitinophaga sp. Ak27]NLU91402.1 hypothetical protein [Chitinophaga sp. Ak27]
MRFAPFDLSALKEEYEENSPAMQELKTVITDVLAEKTWRFKSERIKSKYPISIAEGRIANDGFIQSGFDCGLSDAPINFYALWQQTPVTYALDGTLSDLMEYVQKIRLLFEVDGAIRNGATLERFRQFLFLAVYKQGNFDPVEQLNDLKTDDPSYSLLNVCFLENVDLWDYSFVKFWETVTKFAGNIGHPHHSSFDSRWLAIFSALEKVLDSQIDFALARKIFEINLGDSPIGKIAEAGLFYLSRKGEINNDDLIGYLQDQRTVNVGIIILNSHLSYTLSFTTQIWETMKNVELKKPQRALSYQLGVNLLENTESLSEQLKAELYEYLLLEGVEGDFEQTRAVFYALRKNLKQKGIGEALIKRLIAVDPYPIEFNSLISDYYFHIDDLDGFFAFIRTYLGDENHFFKLTQFKGICELFTVKYPVRFWRGMVELLIDDEGRYRKAGGRMLSHMLHEQSEHIFPVPLEELNPLQQYKFIVSATVYPMFMDENLKVLVPFLFSKSPIVVELALCKLDHIAISYGPEAINKLQPMISNHPLSTEIVERLNSVFTEDAKRIDQKQRIFEFNPHVGYANLIRPFAEFYAKKSSRSMSEAQRKHGGISSFIKQTTIGRGGGVITHDMKIMPLSMVGASFSLPSYIFIDPIGDQAEMFLFYKKNWSEDFKAWKEIISSSGNI